MERVFVIALFVLTLGGCSSNDDSKEPSDDYAAFMADTSIETEVDFMPAEVYEEYSDTPQAPLLKLKLITTEIYPCANYALETTTFIRENELIVRFDGVFRPNICLTAIGPATTHVDLPDSIDRLTFLNGENIDKYTVDINAEKINVTLSESSFTHLLYEHTFRIPENTFAYICGTYTDNTHLYNDFKNVLLSNPALQEFTFVGEGRIPYPESSSGHGVDHPSSFFRYTNEADFDALGTILDDFSSQNIEENSGVTMQLNSWFNKRHLSWD
ncbi:MAG: hypothetical protein Aureis2KO_09920 [Aureisphaera sp.]